MYWQNTVIVGAGDVGQLVARKLLQHPEYAHQARRLRRRPTPKEPRAAISASSDFSARPTQLPELVDTFDIDRVIVAFSRDSHEQTAGAHPQAEGAGRVQIDIVPRLFEAVGPNVDLHTVEALPLIGLPAARAFSFGAIRSSARSTSSVASIALAPHVRRSSPTSPGASSATRPARSSSGRRGSDEHGRVHRAQVPDDAGRRRRRSSTASTSRRR